MKTEDLQKIGLDEEQIKKVFELNGKDVNAEKKNTEKAEADRDQWKNRAESAEKTLKGFDGVDVEGLKGQISEWKAKAEQAEKEYQEKMSEREKADALKAELETVKFSSEAAKRAIMEEINKKVGMVDGKLIGLNDVLSMIKEKDPTAFSEDTPKPKFTQPKGKEPNKPMTRDDILAIKDSRERQTAIAQHIDLFNGGE